MSQIFQCLCPQPPKCLIILEQTFNYNGTTQWKPRVQWGWTSQSTILHLTNWTHLLPIKMSHITAQNGCRLYLCVHFFLNSGKGKKIPSIMLGVRLMSALKEQGWLMRERGPKIGFLISENWPLFSLIIVVFSSSSTLWTSAFFCSTLNSSFSQKVGATREVTQWQSVGLVCMRPCKHIFIN